MNGTIPALTSSKFGSSAINDADGTTTCGRFSRLPDSKKRNQRARISADSNYFFFPRFLVAFAAVAIKPNALTAGPPLLTKLSVAPAILSDTDSTFLVIRLILSSGPFTNSTVLVDSLINGPVSSVNVFSDAFASSINRLLA